MGPLKGIRIIEMAGIGPGPLAGMLLSDLGAEVIRIDRTAGGAARGADPADITNRGRKSIAVDLKQAAGVETVLKLVETADVLFEGFRPGVMEKLGLGPEVCLQRNERLVYGRITGWGQEGTLAHAAGHDINYISITGALEAIGTKDSGPVPPLNLVGDFGGGTMFLIMGILAALLEVKHSGKGQVVDAAMTDGVIAIMSLIHSFKAYGIWEDRRGSNMLDGGAHYYDTYQCADGKWVSIGSIEPQFYAMLLDKLGVDLGEEAGIEAHNDKSKWPMLKEKIAAVIKTKSRSEWCEIMEGTDVCFAPVLSMDEAPKHHHNQSRHSFVEVEGITQSAPAPRFSRTPGAIQGLPVQVGANTDELLQSLGLDAQAIAELKKSGVVV